MGATIQPDRLLRELSELWVSFGNRKVTRRQACCEPAP